MANPTVATRPVAARSVAANRIRRERDKLGRACTFNMFALPLAMLPLNHAHRSAMRMDERSPATVDKPDWVPLGLIL
jgi:hypothetical protein